MKEIEHKAIEVLNSVFSCALSALSSSVTRFPGVSVRDIYEQTFQGEFYAEIRGRFGAEAVEFEAEYPENPKRKNGKGGRCDIALYPNNDFNIWIEVKNWEDKYGKKIVEDKQKLEKIPQSSGGTANYRLLLCYWYEDEGRKLLKRSFSSLVGVKDIGEGVTEDFYWFAIMPGSKSRNQKKQQSCGLSMYVLNNI